MYAAAKDLWHQTAREFYGAEWDDKGELFWNGRFDRPLRIGGGLEWRIAPQLPTGVLAVVSSSRGFEPSDCLRIRFHGLENVQFSHVRHLFFVQPGGRYRLRYRVNALDVTTDNGPYVKLTLHSRPPVHQSGQAVTGTGGWELAEDFRVPETGHLAEIRICRDRSPKLDNKIKGDVWYDEFVQESLAAPAVETPSP
jgi:hypothetical protein